MISLTRLSVFVALVCTWGGIASADAQDSLVGCFKYIPGDANVIVVLRVDQLLHSPRGTKEGWARQTEQAFLGGTEPLPPWIDMGVRAARFSPEEGRLGWSLGLIMAADGFDMNRIAEHEQVKPDSIAGHSVLHTHHDSFVTLVSPKLLAVVSPAYRQEMARWIRKTLRGQPVVELSSYLKDAATNGEPHLLLAVDADSLFDPQRLDAWIKAAPSLARVPADAGFASRLFRGLRGLQLTALVDDTTTAEIRFDFSEDVGNRGELVKRLFLDFLEDSSAVLEDFQQAQVAAAGKSVTLKATLSDSGLKRILSLVVAPQPAGTRPTKVEAGKQPSAPPQPGSDLSASPTAKNAQLEISRKYYRAVNQLVDDLSVRSRRAKYSEKTAVWHDNYARKIEQMSINGVHPDLVNYGLAVAAKLRALGASLRGVPLKVDTLQGSVTYNMSVTPGYVSGGWWGGGGSYGMPAVNVTSNLQQVREKQAEAISQGDDQRQQIWSALDNDRQAIRKKMYDTFRVDFEPTKK